MNKALLVTGIVLLPLVGIAQVPSGTLNEHAIKHNPNATTSGNITISRMPTDILNGRATRNNPNISTSNSIEGAMCPYVMVDAYSLGTQQYDVFSYANGVLTTILNEPASGSISARAMPMSAVNEYNDMLANGSGDVGSSIPLDGSNVIAFEMTISGLNSITSSHAVAGSQITATHAIDTENNLFKEAGYNILVGEQNGARKLTIYGTVFDSVNGQSGYFYDELGVLTEDSVTVGIYYDQNTRRVGLVTEVFGDYGYVPPTNNGGMTNSHPLQELPNTTGMLTGFTSLSNADGVEGSLKVVYKTNASDMTLSFPSGAVDICGNPI